jgi:hypothetical protein
MRGGSWIVGLALACCLVMGCGESENADYIVAFPGMTAEDAQQAVAKFIERREISGPGIDILAERGTFGPLEEVYPDRGDRFAKKAGVDAAQCYALALDSAEVVVFWGGDKPRLIRLDDVGKLE